jgi:hypothetical protein
MALDHAPQAPIGGKKPPMGLVGAARNTCCGGSAGLACRKRGKKTGKTGHKLAADPEYGGDKGQNFRIERRARQAPGPKAPQ